MAGTCPYNPAADICEKHPFIILSDGYRGSDELADEIKSFVRERLSAYAYPRKLEFVTELPKTLTGKIRRIELRNAESQTALRSVQEG